MPPRPPDRRGRGRGPDGKGAERTIYLAADMPSANRADAYARRTTRPRPSGSISEVSTTLAISQGAITDARRRGSTAPTSAARRCRPVTLNGNGGGCGACGPGAASFCRCPASRASGDVGQAQPRRPRAARGPGDPERQAVEEVGPSTPPHRRPTRPAGASHGVGIVTDIEAGVPLRTLARGLARLERADDEREPVVVEPTREQFLDLGAEASSSRSTQGSGTDTCPRPARRDRTPPRAAPPRTGRRHACGRSPRGGTTPRPRRRSFPPAPLSSLRAPIA